MTELIYISVQRTQWYVLLHQDANVNPQYLRDHIHMQCCQYESKFQEPRGRLFLCWTHTFPLLPEGFSLDHIILHNP